MLRNLLTPLKDVDVNPPRESVALGTETTRPIFVDNEVIMHNMLHQIAEKNIGTDETAKHPGASLNRVLYEPGKALRRMLPGRSVSASAQNQG